MYGTEAMCRKNVDTPLVYLSRFYGSNIIVIVIFKTELIVVVIILRFRAIMSL